MLLGCPKKKGDFSYECAQILFTLYGQNDRLYEDRSTGIFIVNTHWYCSIIHLKVSKKNLKEENVLGLMETVNLWFSL